MMGLEQQKTISYGSRGKKSQYNLEKLPPAEHISYNQEMVGEQYGWVKIISPEKRWAKNWNSCYVLTRCQGCGSIQWQDRGNLTTGKSKGCQACSQPRQIPRWLDRRLTAAKQRCTNPKDPEFKNYGERGIKFKFPSILEAGLYLIEKFGLPKRELEIDRIDNDGHYERGNLRFATRIENASNKRNTVLTEFHQKYWPYARSVVIRKLSKGLSRDEIIEDAELAVFEKRKNWKGIEARLDFMIYEMPERITVLPYQGN